MRNLLASTAIGLSLLLAPALVLAQTGPGNMGNQQPGAYNGGQMGYEQPGTYGPYGNKPGAYEEQGAYNRGQMGSEQPGAYGRYDNQQGASSGSWGAQGAGMQGGANGR